MHVQLTFIKRNAPVKIVNIWKILPVKSCSQEADGLINIYSSSVYFVECGNGIEWHAKRFDRVEFFLRMNKPKTSRITATDELTGST